MFERITAGQVLYREHENFEHHEYVYYIDSSYGNLSITLGQGKILESFLKINTLEKISEQKIN